MLVEAKTYPVVLGIICSIARLTPTAEYLDKSIISKEVQIDKIEGINT